MLLTVGLFIGQKQENENLSTELTLSTQKLLLCAQTQIFCELRITFIYLRDEAEAI
jgi:hypothetical protein